MSNVALTRLPLVVPIFACIEEGRVRLFGEGNYGEQRVSDQGSASGHRGSYNLFWLSFISMLINTSRGKLHTLISLILFSLFLCAPSLASAATYYVAPSGSNSSPGTQAAPFATLQKAINIAVAGDTIYLRGGTYQFSAETTFTRSGSSGNYIKVWAYPGETPVIDAINTPANSYPLFLRSGASWWHIKGLEVKNGVEGGISLYDSSNNIIENNNVHHNREPGIIVRRNSANNLILNNDSHHNRDINLGDADGFNLSTTGGGNVWRGNRAWRNSDDGFDNFCVMNGATCASMLIENNWSWENGLDDNLQPLGNGVGFKLGGIRSGTGGSSGGHTVKNNLAWKNRTDGFNENVAQRPMILYNNTGWDNRSVNYRFSTLANTFRNNISFGTRGAISGSDTFNSWTLGVTVSTADFSSLDDTIARGPRKADGSLPSSNFLRLVAGSNLIDRGVNVDTAYVGSAPDLGAYEYGGSDTPSSAPPPASSSSCTQTPLTVSSAFSDGGFSYMVIKTFGTAADNSNNPTQSTLRFYENGVEMGPAHSLHSNISNLGVGRFSHWSNAGGEALRFSASDNSNPRTNGKSYTYCVPVR